MNAPAVWKKFEDWLRRIRTIPPPDWERTRARGCMLFMVARGTAGALMVGAYLAAQAAVEQKGAAAPAFFTGDYFVEWMKGMIVGLIGGCAVGFWDWEISEGAYRRAKEQAVAAAPHKDCN